MSKQTSSVELLEKQTSSVEFLANAFIFVAPELWGKLKVKFQQAKAMHKSEIESAYLDGCTDNMNDEDDVEYYYNEIFGGSE
jgi:hypothetical protein